MHTPAWFAASLLIAVATHASAQSSVTLRGVVTTAGSGSFAVNGTPILCDEAHTRARFQQSDGASNVHIGCPAHRLGENVVVVGSRQKASASMQAASVQSNAPADVAVTGFALIDRVLAPLSGGTAIFRADGYPLTITPATRTTFEQGASLTLATVGTNVWIRYTGTLHLNGTVTTTSALFSPNHIKPAEDTLRTKSDFDAAAVKEEDRQGKASRFFNGVRAKQLPASGDAAAQQRLTRIGDSLVPAYQRQLATDDPTRIDFRFQLVHDPKLHNTITSPSGIIQVPEEIPSTLTSDDQLAAILSAAVAEVLEKQALRSIPGNRARSASNLAGTAAGFLLPGAGLATSLVTAKSASVAEHHRVEQTLRTGLSFLHDAGFDITQAPVAWWTLGQKPKTPLAETRLPGEADYLYQLLYTVDRPISAPPPL